MNQLAPIATAQFAAEDELWYKDAIIYQLHVKAFADSNNDGIGDFPGLTDKLDYLQELGVTAIWLLPFYPSPGRDDGYDIADYGSINPDFGTMKDFRRFITEAKRRGLRVITELVINHTSDQHPWFRRARRSPPGSSARDWYVWSDTDTALCADPHHLHRHGKIELDLGPGGERLLLASLLLAPARPEFRQSARRQRRGAGDEALARRRRRRLPAGCHSLPLRARGHVEREPSRDPRRDQAAARRARRLREGKGAARGGQPVAGGRAAVFRRRRRMPHGLPLPADAAHLHGDRPGRPLPDRRHPAPDAGHPGQLPVGDVPAQPRRTDARDGDRHRARLSVVDLRRRPARPHQSRHPPPPCAADGQRPAQDRTDEFAADVVPRHADRLLRRRDRHGRQHLSRRPQRRAHADAVVARTATAASRAAIRRASMPRR